eukprot:589137_1
MNHSINNLLWITLFAVLYISSVNGACQDPTATDACTDCPDDNSFTCLGSPGPPGGCGCHMVGSGPATCEDFTCDPTIDPTIDPTSDPTVDPTIDPTQMPTAPTSNPSITPTSNP